jgi:hypothetical protein
MMKNKSIRNAVLLVLSLLAAWGLWPSRHYAPAQPAAAESITAQARSADAPLFTITQVAPEAARSEPVSAAPVIDAIELEKTDVCEGEENLVTVKAHTTDGTDAFLHVVVLGQGSGSSVPVRGVLDKHGVAVFPEIRVFGKDGVVTEAKLPPFRVHSCPARRNLIVSFQKMPNTLAGYRLYGSVVEHERNESERSNRPRLVSYEWDFGDGERLDDSAPYAEHHFSRIDPNKRYSSFVVKLSATDERGEKLIGSTTLELENDAFEALRVKNVVQLFYSMEPRYAVLGADGVVRQHFHVFHRYSQAIELTNLRLSWLGEDKTENLPPQVLLGTDNIPPGPGIDFELAVSRSDHPKFYGLNVTLEGFSQDGHAASGLVSLMKPGENPSRAQHVAVTDPNITARILRARQLLKQEFVSDEDLSNLEQQGKFDDLQAAPARVAQADRELVHQFKRSSESR